MRLLDLFAGAQGAGVGYARAGFDVTAVDIETHARHPEVSEFVTADALDVLRDVDYVRSFHVVHASPPCQAYSSTAGRWKGREHPRLIEPVRNLLVAAGVPYVIENVPRAAAESARVVRIDVRSRGDLLRRGLEAATAAPTVRVERVPHGARPVP